MACQQTCGIDDIPADTLEDCSQLVKQNSIQGCKSNDVQIVYTPWGNLKKTASMEVGQVGFHDEKLRRYTKVARKSNDILNRLEKTRRELQPDFKTEKEVCCSLQPPCTHAAFDVYAPDG
eukprot:GHRQ01029310.1.p2 GENE.GHRQ01029310.1~~GHRQ01029310.1.p2  ORF type:complete len:120 (+),score=33.48 GHRQ01029310.1:1033-1392(+)